MGSSMKFSKDKDKNVLWFQVRTLLYDIKTNFKMLPSGTVPIS
jgi:hypothetical protein